MKKDFRNTQDRILIDCPKLKQVLDRTEKGLAQYIKEHGLRITDKDGRKLDTMRLAILDIRLLLLGEIGLRKKRNLPIYQLGGMKH